MALTPLLALRAAAELPVRDDELLARIEGAIVGAVAAVRPEPGEPLTTVGFRASVLAHLDEAGRLGRADRAAISLSATAQPTAVDRALDRSTELFAKALRDKGMPDQVLALLQSWLAVPRRSHFLTHQCS